MDDLLTLASLDTTLKRVASTNGGEYAGPCPFCGGSDRFRVWPDHPKGGGQWWCRQCGRGGDLIAYRVERGEITPREAGKLRHNGENAPHKARRARGPRRTPKETPPPAPVRAPADAPPAKWREQARIFCEYCAGQLLGGDNPGLEHLHARGLDDSTLEAWGLGWYDGRYGHYRAPSKWGLAGGKRIYLPAGVTIPWKVDGEIWHVKARRFDEEGPKYIRIRGGSPTLYGLDHLAGGDTVAICEGELDAVLLWQEAGDLLDVVAIGSKGNKAEPKGLAHLLGASRWLLALDTDAGNEADVWAGYSGRVRRARPLEGNDLTDFHAAGGDLRAWISWHLESDAVARSEALLAGGPWGEEDREKYLAIQRARGWLRFDDGHWIAGNWTA